MFQNQQYQTTSNGLNAMGIMQSQQILNQINH